MSNFVILKRAIQDQIALMDKLYVIDVDKELLWETYIKSFLPEDDPLFRERTEHNCNCCRAFIRQYGGLVSINHDYTIDTIWNVIAPREYQKPVEALNELIKSSKIRDVFVNDTYKLGTNKNVDTHSEIVWEHFYCEVDPDYVKRNPDAVMGEERSRKDVAKRGLEELSLDSVLEVLNMIQENTLYRGAEFNSSLISFKNLKIAYELLSTDARKDNFAWKHRHSACIRNSVIGTLLVDLSEGVSVDHAVTSFEKKVAPINYKRPTAIITKRMVEDAQKAVRELGYEDSLPRRHAQLSDITINNVLFASSDTKVALNVFDEIMPKAKPVGNFETVDMETFLDKVLPNTTKLEIVPEKTGNFMTLIAPKHWDAKNILKWNNNFSWVYSGNVTDSIADKVKRAGGSVDGALRCSLEWFNYDDLDIHVVVPGGAHIFYGNRRVDSGVLDVDMNVSPTTRTPVENIVWTNPKPGVYKVFVHNFTRRETKDVGFNVEIVSGNTHWGFNYDKVVDGYIDVIEFEYPSMEIIKANLKENRTPKPFWGVQTYTFQEVAAVIQSPNHWDEQAIGNKHWFFILKDCKNPEPIRGLFNEYLNNDLEKHRKVFEVLGNKMMVEPSENQMSGIGFSATKRDSFLVKADEKTFRVEV